MRVRRLALLLAAWLIAALPIFGSEPMGVAVQFGPEVSPRVRERVVELLRLATGGRVREVAASAQIALGSGELLAISCGQTEGARRLIPEPEPYRLGDEGFVVRCSRRGDAVFAAVNGNPREGSRMSANLGLTFGIYALLERLGFAFLHPLAPIVPAGLKLPAADVDVREAPHWGIRGTHLHTMHPLELTHLLNGWGRTGPDDAAGFEQMLPDWDRCLEWLVANRQNHVQWVLLEGRTWTQFSRSAARAERLKRLVAKAKDWGVEVGIDVPIALAQQNGFRLVTKPGTIDEEKAQIRQGVDWLAAIGFDYISTEVGFSEFHSPDDLRMVAWLNELTDYLARKYGRQAHVKAHVSIAEHAQHFKDPLTGEPLNYNFIPYYADPRMTVLVHTVEFYGLDDPAPTYGRRDFADLRRYLGLEAGRRPVIWYPETAYWVSFDIDVPLFLPIYAERRLHDARLIARDEAAGRLGTGEHAGSRIQGQIVFSSGWEWGYWLNDVVAARAAWNPHLEIADDSAAFLEVLEEALTGFGDSAPAVALGIQRMARDQKELLIRGAGSKTDPVTGQSYLEGFSTWDEVMAMATKMPMGRAMLTKPDRIGPVDVRGRSESKRYEQEIRPVIARMVESFTAVADGLESLAGKIPEGARELYGDLRDASRMTALRAQQMLGLYDNASRYREGDAAWKKARLAEAQGAVDRASAVVAGRELHYRVDAQRIAGWGANPTVYPYGYLWTVRSLYYWWRDEGKVLHRPANPCYLNVLDAAEVATAEGRENNVHKLLTFLSEHLGFAFGWLEACLDPPVSPPDMRKLVRDALK